MTRQQGIEKLLMVAFANIAKIQNPKISFNLTPEVNASIIELAKVLTSVYVSPVIDIPAGVTTTISHPLGYEPLVTMTTNGIMATVISKNDTSVNVYSLTAGSVVLYCS